MFPLRLVFTSNGVGVGVEIRSVELYDQVKTRSSESQAEVQELSQSQSVGTCIVSGSFFLFCFRLRQSGFYLIVSDGVTSGIGRKWKLSDSYDSDCFALATSLTIPTPASSLVKTSL